MSLLGSTGPSGRSVVTTRVGEVERSTEISEAPTDALPVHDSRRHFGQYFTPPGIATFMAGFLDFRAGSKVRLLDAGAGTGVLAAAAVATARSKNVGDIEVTLVERDREVIGRLEAEVASWGLPADRVSLVEENFVLGETVNASDSVGFSHAILNPPYVQLGAGDPMSISLRAKKIFVPNLYAAFVWLAIDRLDPEGQLVAIIPRSFCNGVTFTSLREHIFSNSSIEAIHLFTSRHDVFVSDGVLQETLVVKLVKKVQSPSIALSWSNGSPTLKRTTATVDRTRVIPDEGEKGMIRIPSWDAPIDSPSKKDWGSLIPAEYEVSTGSVVDFRASESVHKEVAKNRVPLVDGSFGGFKSTRRRAGAEENDPPLFARYLDRAPSTEKFVFPEGNYVVIRRMSPKEQSPRIRCALVRASDLAGLGGVAFENHVNVIHQGKKGLTLKAATELVKRLKSPETEAQFAELSGTTQVNLSDIRALRHQ